MFSKYKSIHEAMLLVYEELEKIIKKNKITEISRSKEIEIIWNSLCLSFSSYARDINVFLENLDKTYDSVMPKYDFLVAFLWFYDKERLFAPLNDKFKYKNLAFSGTYSKSTIEEGIRIRDYFILPIIHSEIKGKLINNYEKIVSKTVHEKNIINRFLLNYSIVKNKDNLISLKTIEMHKFVERIKSNGLKVALNPIAYKNFEYYFTMITHVNPCPSFSVKVVEDHEKELINVFSDSLNKSVAKGVDLIIFPEMHLTTKLLEQIPSMIKYLKIERQSLIMVGTLSNETSNMAYLFDNYGNLVLKQKKYGQFLLRDPNNINISYVEGREWNDAEDVLLALLDIVDFGRMSIFICKDIYEPKKKDALINCSVDFLLMPSYSESNSISDCLNDLAKSRVISFFVNSFNAFLKKKENIEKILGKVVLPYWDEWHKQKFVEHVLNPKITRIERGSLTIDLIL
ncbi:MAG: hypothetical protein WC366_02555 [Bacilli bacterium]|jgi:hypothetical protein